jgi:hypothetical protein
LKKDIYIINTEDKNGLMRATEYGRRREPDTELLIEGTLINVARKKGELFAENALLR